MIKVLDASSLHQGIDQTVEDLNSLSTQIMEIQKTIDSFISLEDSFKGQAAESIRSFYREGHVPLLLLMEGFMKEYQDTLKKVQDALISMESDENGFVRQVFLQNDLEPKIRQAENVTIELTNDMNAAINSVRDIVSLPSINDSEFLYRAKDSKEMIHNTLEKVQTFDAESTSSLGKIENDLHLMKNYINKINSMFRSGNISVGNYSIRQLSGYEFHQDLLHAVSKKARTNAFSLDVLLGMGANSVLSRFGPLSKHLVHYHQEKFEMRTMDYSMRAMQGIIQASSNRISIEQFATIKDQIVNSKDISDYQGEWHGKYFTLLDGRLVREFTNTSGAISYRFVDKIPKNRIKPVEKNMFQKSVDAFKEIGSDIWKGLDTRADKATDSWYDFGNYLTLGSFDLGKDMSTGLQYNAENMLNSPSDFINWMTIGGVDTINAVINPEESFSKDHWLASITLASVVAGGAKVPRGKTPTPNASTKVPSVEKAPKTSSVPLVTKLPRLNTLTNIREWFRVNVPEIGLVYDTMGGYHLVVRKGDGGGSGGSGVKGKETYQHLKDYKNNKYFTRSVEYNAGKDGTGFTYKVYQRGDINWDMVRTKGAKKGRGLTNAEASKKYGLAPILDDAGSVATLHHSQQKGVGPLYEASTRYHNISNAKRAPLHPYKGKLNPFYPMDEATRGAFQKIDSINYWKIRGEEALGGK